MPAPTISPVNMRDFSGASVPLKSTNNGSSYIPHHIQDDVSIAPLASSTTAFVSGFLFSAVAKSLINFDAFTDVDCYVALLDQAAIQANGAMTPLKFWKLYADQHFWYAPKYPIQCVNGIVLVCSSNASPFTLTKTTHLFASMEMSNQYGEAS